MMEFLIQDLKSIFGSGNFITTRPQVKKEEERTTERPRISTAR